MCATLHRVERSRSQMRRAGGVLVGVLTLFVLAAGISSDQPVEKTAPGFAGAWTTIVDEVPPGVLPDLAEITLVLIVLASVVGSFPMVEHRWTHRRRDRAPPSLSILG